MSLRQRLARLQAELDQADDQQAGTLLRTFAGSLSPAHRAILSDALAVDTPGLDDMPEHDLDRLLLGALDTDTLGALITLAARYQGQPVQLKCDLINRGIEDLLAEQGEKA